jgi:cytochrome c oxidase cbb3-type subunit 1
MAFAASPAVYPPIDRTTGGPTGSSLQGSALVVIGLMLLLPRVVAGPPRASRHAAVWIYFAASWLVFGATEALGGTHHDARQILPMLLLLPWVWLLPRDWRGFDWPRGSESWRGAMFAWWGLLVVSSLVMYRVGVLDRIKFTQVLVAHSHLAMAGFTTSFCALLCVLLTRRAIGGRISVAIWHGAVLAMMITLAASGWMEGANPHWMAEPPGWRTIGFVLRAVCGTVMLAVSLNWLWKAKSS